MNLRSQFKSKICNDRSKMVEENENCLNLSEKYFFREFRSTYIGIKDQR